MYSRWVLWSTHLCAVGPSMSLWEQLMSGIQSAAIGGPWDFKGQTPQRLTVEKRPSKLHQTLEGTERVLFLWVSEGGEDLLSL